MFAASWVVGLTAPLFSLGPWPALEISGRDLILIIGGAFLVYKAVTEIRQKLEGHEASKSTGRAVSFTAVIIQIILLDMVFSLDSVITAVGMVDERGGAQPDLPLPPGKAEPGGRSGAGASAGEVRRRTRSSRQGLRRMCHEPSTSSGLRQSKGSVASSSFAVFK